jgi:hypothetical protein
MADRAEPIARAAKITIQAITIGPRACASIQLNIVVRYPGAAKPLAASRTGGLKPLGHAWRAERGGSGNRD